MVVSVNDYWSQWSHAELMSMHGIELVDDFTYCEDSTTEDEYHEQNDIDLEQVVTPYDLDMLTSRDFL